MIGNFWKTSLTCPRRMAEPRRPGKAMPYPTFFRRGPADPIAGEAT